MNARSLVTWALVMDGDHIYISDISSENALPIMVHEDFQEPPLTHIHGTDKPGRGGFNLGSETRHSFQPRHDWHDFQKDLFAKKAAKYLNDPNSVFDQLVVIAPAKILGVLRDEFSKKTSSKIIKEMSKDLVHLPMHKLQEYLASHQGCC